MRTEERPESVLETRRPVFRERTIFTGLVRVKGEFPDHRGGTIRP